MSKFNFDDMKESKIVAEDKGFRVDKKRFKFKTIDILQVIILGFVLYFFIFGVIIFFNGYTYCDYSEKDYYQGLNHSLLDVRLNMNQVQTYVNVSGLFRNVYSYNVNQKISNCSFIK